MDVGNKRILKNTLLLYIRMIVTTGVSLFTARVTLKLLGVEDFGIYNIVGSVIGFMNIITGTMVSATQRFLAYDLGRSNKEQYQQTFSILVNVFAVFCVIALVIMELIGPYFISEYLVIPQERLAAAQWIFQFSVMSFILGTLIIPYDSSIIAYERMGIYAYFTFIDVAFKLIIVFTLYLVHANRLIVYGALMLLMTFVSKGMAYWYCVKKLEDCIYKPYWDKSLFKKIFSYSGWNLFGSISGVMNIQGQAILLNLFFGPVVNAAKAVADRINTIVYSFCFNFYMAVNPQIIKTYAAGEIKHTKSLILWSSKLAFFLMLLLSLPLIFNMKELLWLWLGKEQVSFEMVRFSQLVLVFTTINTLESPITQVIRATGNIKKYQIQVGIQTLLFIPITYILFKIGFPAYFSMIVLTIIYLIVLLTRIRIMGKVIDITYIEYARKVFVPIVGVTVSSFIISYFALNQVSESIPALLSNCILVVFIVCLLVYLLGLSRRERGYLHKVIARYM